MLVADIKKIIENNKGDIAFIIGNGINRYSTNSNIHSWNNLLIQLWSDVSLHTLSKIPSGISLTEFYDILDLENTQNINLQRMIVSLMSKWKPFNHHQLITNRIRDINAPILTTNFENTLAKACKLSLFKTSKGKFTDFYPWTSYYGDSQLISPIDGFGIWHINGMIKYHRSIRLGLSHYMGSVERARNFIHKGNEENLFSGKNMNNWRGFKTWLHIIFNKSLFIFGLGLEENEVFLRWLLIERIKYFKQFPNRKHKGWYISKKENNAGKKFFLEKVGFEIIEVDDYSDIYENIWK